MYVEPYVRPESAQCACPLLLLLSHRSGQLCIYAVMVCAAESHDRGGASSSATAFLLVLVSSRCYECSIDFVTGLLYDVHIYYMLLK